MIAVARVFFGIFFVAAVFAGIVKSPDIVRDMAGGDTEPQPVAEIGAEAQIVQPQQGVLAVGSSAPAVASAAPVPATPPQKTAPKTAKASDAALTAKNTTVFTVEVIRAGSGSGVVSGGPISCGGTCVADVNAGTVLTLKATPANGSAFAGWSGACTGTGTCALSVLGVRNVVALFEPLTQAAQAQTQAAGFTAAQVASHAARTDCWIIISGKIYDVTNWINTHPGGVTAITSRCGTDTTAAFSSNANGGHAHSSYAYSLLPSYYIADVGAAVQPTTQTATPTPTPTPTPSSTQPAANAPTQNTNASSPTTGTGYTTAQVATHVSPGDCWLIISGKVYNVTNWINTHPGGVTAITSRCGTDSTTAFTTSGGGGHAHSSYAYSLLPSYYVGDVAGSSSGSTSGTTGSTAGGTAGGTTGGSTGSNGATTYTVHVTSAGNYDVTSLSLNAGDSITFVYSPPVSGEVRTTFSPGGVSSVTLDSEYTQRTHAFTAAGTWTFRAADHSGNSGTVTVH